MDRWACTMRTISLRWLMGTHAGAVSDKHLQAYLDEKMGGPSVTLTPLNRRRTIYGWSQRR